MQHDSVNDDQPIPDVASLIWAPQLCKRSPVQAIAAVLAIRGNFMTVYIDDAIWNWQGLRWCHLMADDIDELHRFAARLGVNRNSYQGPPRTSAPHYDLTSFERVRAIGLGAKPCNRAEIVAVFRAVRHARGKRKSVGR